MRKIMILFLTALMILLVPSCSRSGQIGQVKSLYEEKVCPANEALEWAKSRDAVVFEDGRLTSGEDVWGKFYENAGKGKKCAVLVADYMTLDNVNMSEELYEQEKDNYPVMELYLLEYDGDVFTINIRESDKKDTSETKSFKYLLHFTGDAPSQALYKTYDEYVLVNDPDLTHERIIESMVSSILEMHVEHFTVYRNCID